MGKSWLSEYGLLGGGWETPLRADIRRAYEVAEGTEFERMVAVCRCPGVHAMVVFRYGQWALQQPQWARWLLDPVYALLNFLVKACWGIELSRYAQIGQGLYISNFGGINVDPSATLGRYCNISNSITIASGGGRSDIGPMLGDDVYVAPGVRIIGPISVGNNVRIGPNAVVTSDVPDNAVVALDPGYKITSFRGNREPIGIEKKDAQTV